MKRFFISLAVFSIAVFSLTSCDDKSQNTLGVFEITDSVRNVGAVIFDWTWSSDGARNVDAKFTVDKDEIDYLNEGGATAYSISNKTGIISDVYTYKGGKPDLDPANRLWVIRYSGDATQINVKWEGTLTQLSGKGKSTVEVLFQVYGDWPAYANNIRPQVETDTLFLGAGITPAIRDSLREDARERMIARYYNTSLEVGQTLTINADDTYLLREPIDEPEDEDEDYFEDEDELDESPALPNTVFRMQLFVRVINNEGDPKAEYRISDGRLEIEFL